MVGVKVVVIEAVVVAVKVFSIVVWATVPVDVGSGVGVEVLIDLGVLVRVGTTRSVSSFCDVINEKLNPGINPVKPMIRTVNSNPTKAIQIYLFREF